MTINIWTMHVFEHSKNLQKRYYFNIIIVYFQTPTICICPMVYSEYILLYVQWYIVTTLGMYFWTSTRINISIILFWIIEILIISRCLKTYSLIYIAK